MCHDKDTNQVFTLHSSTSWSFTNDELALISGTQNFVVSMVESITACYLKTLVNLIKTIKHEKNQVIIVRSFRPRK